MTDIALFPIPNAIAFPGTVFPLHVFEPRYRAMIDEAVEAERLIGICHTKKEIRPAPPDQTLEKALSANQATYQPHEIFSAGACEIIERTEDGRIIVNIHVENRYVAGTEIQTLPYRIVEATILEDERESEDLGPLCESVHALLLQIVKAKDPKTAARIESEGWTDLPPSRYSFQLFQVLQFDPETMQTLLASTSPQFRLEHIHTMLAYHTQARDH